MTASTLLRNRRAWMWSLGCATVAGTVVATLTPVRGPVETPVEIEPMVVSTPVRPRRIAGQITVTSVDRQTGCIRVRIENHSDVSILQYLAFGDTPVIETEFRVGGEWSRDWTMCIFGARDAEFRPGQSIECDDQTWVDPDADAMRVVLTMSEVGSERYFHWTSPDFEIPR